MDTIQTNIGINGNANGGVVAAQAVAREGRHPHGESAVAVKGQALGCHAKVQGIDATRLTLRSHEVGQVLGLEEAGR